MAEEGQPELSQFEKALAERRAKKAEEARVKASKEKLNDLVPEPYEKGTQDDEIDRIIDKIDIVDAYTRWIRKMKPVRRPGQTEGVMISCPMPNHADRNPSAWMNTQKGTWFCAACDRGGDKYDLAAIGFGTSLSGYKSGQAFHDLRRSMVRDYGYVVQKSTLPGVPDNVYRETPEPAVDSSGSESGAGRPEVHGGDAELERESVLGEHARVERGVSHSAESVDNEGLRSDESDRGRDPVHGVEASASLWDDDQPEGVGVPSLPELKALLAKRNGSAPTRAGLASVPEPETTDSGSFYAEPPAPESRTPGLALVTPLPEVQEEVGEEFTFISPTIDWREIIPEETFLYKYLETCTVDSAPEEYHFWNGLMAIALAAGRNIWLWDSTPVFANFMACLLGPTGTQKSRSIAPMEQLLHSALPYMPSNAKGILSIDGTGSGEMLVKLFEHLEDPPPGAPRGAIPMPSGNPVRALLMWPEMSELVARAGRAGSTIKGALMQIADAKQNMSTATLGRGIVRAENGYGCVLTTTQPESLKDLLTDGDMNSGFLNRWIFVPGKTKYQPGLGAIRVDTGHLAFDIQEINERDETEIGWTDEAREYWEDHFQNILLPLKHKNPLLGRLDLTEKKLILLFCINEHIDRVTADVVQRVTMLHDYLVRSYGITGESMLGSTVSTEMYEAVIYQIRRLSVKPGMEYGPTRTQIRSNVRKMPKFDEEMFNKTLRNLERDENIVVNEGRPGAPGRKGTHYKWVGLIA